MKRILLFFLMILTFFSCEKDLSNPLSNDINDQTDNGSLKIILNVDNMPDEVVKVSGVLTREDMDPVTFNLEIGDQYASARLEDIAVGSWSLVVRAFNAEDIVIYSGATILEIIGGQLNSVNLGLSSTGDLLVNVTWGDEEKVEELLADRFEENDDMIHASSIGEYFYYENLTISENDDDWYSIYLSADSISLKCLFDHDKGDINVEIVDRNGIVLKSSNSVTDNEITSYVVDQLGEYFIRVYLVTGGQNTYTLWWDDIWVWDNYKKSAVRNRGEGVE